METLLYICIYVLGCVLAYGRANATARGNGMGEFSAFVLLSWLWFFAGIISWLSIERGSGIKFLKY